MHAQDRQESGEKQGPWMQTKHETNCLLSSLKQQ